MKKQIATLDDAMTPPELGALLVDIGNRLQSSGCGDCGMIPLLDSDKGLVHDVFCRSRRIDPHKYVDARSREWIESVLSLAKSAIRRTR